MQTERSNDYLIMMVKNLHDVRSTLSIGTREQLRRINLISIKAYCSSCMRTIRPNDGNDMYYILTALNAVIEICTAKLNEPGFVETDVDEKDFIVTNVLNAERQLCVLAGKHYTHNKFEYKPSLNEIYQFIIDTCVENNYYFGLDKQILKEVNKVGH